MKIRFSLDFFYRIALNKSNKYLGQIVAELQHYR